MARMAAAEERYVINAKISREAMEGWTHWRDEYGPTITGMIEAIGRNMARKSMTKDGRALIKQALAIDTERRRRPKNGARKQQGR